MAQKRKANKPNKAKEAKTSEKPDEASITDASDMNTNDSGHNPDETTSASGTTASVDTMAPEYVETKKEKPKKIQHVQCTTCNYRCEIKHRTICPFHKAITLVPIEKLNN